VEIGRVPKPKKTGALTHLDAAGRVRQVDVGAKPETLREAEARGFLRVSPAALGLLAAGRLKKGSPLEVARIAGIQAAKRTAELIPLCHPVPLNQVEVEARVTARGIEIKAVARARWHTGVEMEALTAAAVALLTAYDMLKAADRTMVIERVRLVRKTGGASGDYQAAE
jgi:cyclic pyranopterin phosphate synthase